MRSGAGFLRAVAVGLVLATAALADGGAGDVAIAQLRRAAAPQPDSSHLPLLMSLRQMRDPALEAFFRRLLLVPDWQVQVHGVLGLAEIGPFDPWLLTQMDPRGQEHVIAYALDEKMIDAAATARLLEWEGLEPMGRLLLLAEQVQRGEPVPQRALQRLAASGNLQVAGLAACLLVQSDDQASLSPYRERLSGLSRRDRQQHLALIFEGIRQYSLDRCLPLVIEALDEPEPSRALMSGGVLACLQLDPAQGLPLWKRFLETDSAHSHRVRFALLLAAAADKLQPAAFDAVPRGDPLIDAITRAGRTIAGRADPVTAFQALVDLDHLQSTDWVLARCRDLPAAQAAAVYAHLIDSIDSSQSADRVSITVKAVSRLFQIDPAAVIERMRGAEEGSLAEQVLLLGLFDSTSPRVLEAVGDIRRVGPRRTDSMALILLARHGAALSEEDVRRLETIAAGGGRVSEMLQVQAAWLSIRRAGGAEAALAQVFNDS
jgi:hypothetical protein